MGNGPDSLRLEGKLEACFHPSQLPKHVDITADGISLPGGERHQLLEVRRRRRPLSLLMMGERQLAQRPFMLRLEVENA